jgi:DNA-binding CsgD family transcriptional regulator
MEGFRYTVRERQILYLMAADRSDKQIALQLGISSHTLRSHVDRLFRRHRLHSRAAAVAAWICDSHGLDVPFVVMTTGPSPLPAPASPKVSSELL